MDERILFFSHLEFAVLLLTEGITQVRCFPLPEAETVDEKQMIEAIYELVQTDCVRIEDGAYQLTETGKAIVSPVHDAEYCLVIFPGDESVPQKICYLGTRIMVLENVQEEGKAFRVFSLDYDRFWDWMEANMDIPEAWTVKKEEADDISRTNMLIQEEQKKLSLCSYSGYSGGISEWMSKVKLDSGVQVYAGMQLMRMDGTIQDCLMLCQGMMNLWFMEDCPEEDIFSQQRKPVLVEPDSDELRCEILEKIWRKKA